MKFSEMSIYRNIQVTYNKIYQLKEYECAKNGFYRQEMVDFWNYVLEKCLDLMRHAKKFRTASVGGKCLLTLEKYKICLNDITYHDVLLFNREETEKINTDKRKYMNYALFRGYFSTMVSKEADNFSVKGEYSLMDIAEKLEELEYVLLTQKNICERKIRVQEIFA